ncbi:MAG TPA: polysaccharide deacetylase family protein [Coriobacteriia bacterium]|jgi:peptidoglycan/xylan/chitin deacetylase (PgdA/CDA1 family)
MSERTSQTGRGTGGGSPSTRPGHRKGRQPFALYIAGVAVVLILGAAVLWATGALKGLVGQAPRQAARPVATTTSTPATGTPSAAPSATPLPATASAESAAAVKAAALPYPNPPAVTPETIRKTTPSRKLVAITLDDGIPFNTKILDLLESNNVRCTTFLLGQAVKEHPDLVERLNKDGFEIANHTWDHKTLTKLSDSQIRDELSKTQAAISAITGNQAPYMRPPGGGTNKRVERVAASMGYRVVLWNKSFADTSKYATPEKLYHNIIDTLQPGDIILCHWGAPSKTGGPGNNTYEALKLILPELQRRGFTPVTLSELLKYSSTSAGTAAVQGQGGAGTPAPTAEATVPGAPGAAARRRTTSAAVFQK